MKFSRSIATIFYWVSRCEKCEQAKYVEHLCYTINPQFVCDAKSSCKLAT